MKLIVLSVASLSLPACLNSEPGPAPDLVDDPSGLVGFNGQWQLDQKTSGDQVVGLTVWLSRSDGRCFLFPAEASVTLDGVAGEINRGGYDTGDGEWPHNEDGCSQPSVHWPAFDTGTTALIEASDGDVSWTIEVEQPFVQRTLVLTTPTTMPVHSGDELAFEVQPASDEVMSPYVEVWTEVDRPQTLHVNNGVVLEDNRVRATLPPLSGTQLDVKASATVTLDVLRCEGPTSCLSLATARSTMSLALAR